jgi:predicted nucleotidyltransferase
LQRLLERARADPDVLAVIRFGSSARGDVRPDSDVDVCLVLVPSRYDPADLTEKRMAYSQAEGIDASVFQMLPLYIRRRVLREGQVEYTRDEDALYELAYRTAQAFEDFKHIYHDYLDQVARG